jgi:ElaB/YqjD/DUF883 family membrane-anchored ribosome-binding protein
MFKKYLSCGIVFLFTGCTDNHLDQAEAQLESAIEATKETLDEHGDALQDRWENDVKQELTDLQEAVEQTSEILLHEGKTETQASFEDIKAKLQQTGADVEAQLIELKDQIQAKIEAKLDAQSQD